MRSRLRCPLPECSAFTPSLPFVMRLLALLLLFGSAACAPAAPGSARLGPADSEFAIGEIPDHVGGFALAETTRFELAAGGSLYRYRDGSALVPDVYVYPDERARSGAPPLARAREESAAFKAVLAMQQQQRQFDRFEILADSSVSIPFGTLVVEGWHVEARLFRGVASLETHQHLFAIGDQMLKIRATFPPGDPQARDLDLFIAELLRLLLVPAR